jgi:hypothetical protein
LNLSIANCCGQIFDPKPYFTKTGVCFASQSMKAESGIMINYDVIMVEASYDTDQSSGSSITQNNFYHLYL